MRTQFQDGADLRQYVKQESGETCVVAFSMGKDSIAAWCSVRDLFPRLVPYYLYLVPGLSFIDESLAYYERALGTPIIRLPHPSLYRMLGNRVFQPPERWSTIEAADLPAWGYSDIYESVRREAPGAWVAQGVRMADSPMRRVSIKRHGPLSHKRQTFFPVYDWNKQQVIDAVRSSGLRLPVDYQMFGRSFDGIDARFLAPIRDRFPNDYRRILEWFPLADLELFRLEHCHG